MRTARDILLLLSVVILSSGYAWASGIPIDPEFPAVQDAPLPMPIYYEFRTSWDGIQWTEEQKESVRGALEYLGSFFTAETPFEELDTPDDFSIRWAGADFFKDQGPGWTIGGQPLDSNWKDALAVAFKSTVQPPAGFDETKYPKGEIYFNTQYNWHYNPFTPPEEGLPDDPNNKASYTDGEFDFWSILLHETIHMMCVEEHAVHENEVMFGSISDGEQKYIIRDSDKDLLRDAGYPIIPEPGSLLTLGGGLLGLTGMAIRRRRR